MRTIGAISLVAALMAAPVQAADIPHLVLTLLQKETTQPEPHPRIRLTPPANFKIVGGGCRVNWADAGSLLTACYPENNTWVAAAKDHQLASPATITAWALAIYDPNDEWDVTKQSATSAQANHPLARAALPAGYVLTGGGASANWSGAGSLLTASFPDTDQSWTARAKDHMIADPATVTAYVIGIRPRNGAIGVQSQIIEAQRFDRIPVAHPHDSVVAGSGQWVFGCGAEVSGQGPGNLLTAIYPSLVAFGGSGQMVCIADSKDHMISSPAIVTAYAVVVTNPIVEWHSDPNSLGH